MESRLITPGGVSTIEPMFHNNKKSTCGSASEMQNSQHNGNRDCTEGRGWWWWWRWWDWDSGKHIVEMAVEKNPTNYSLGGWLGWQLLFQDATWSFGASTANRCFKMRWHRLIRFEYVGLQRSRQASQSSPNDTRCGWIDFDYKQDVPIS